MIDDDYDAIDDTRIFSVYNMAITKIFMETLILNFTLHNLGT